jgi:hypothetical protein
MYLMSAAVDHLTGDISSPSYPVELESPYLDTPRDAPPPSHAANFELLHPGNPVARAHARAARNTASESTAHGSLLCGVLLWTVVIPVIVFLVSNPLGWVALLMLVLGFAALSAFGAIL